MASPHTTAPTTITPTTATTAPTTRATPALVIHDIHASAMNQNAADITWTLDGGSGTLTSWIEYGTAPDKTDLQSRVTQGPGQHTVDVENLYAKTYYYHVLAHATGGGPANATDAASQTYAFTAEAAPTTSSTPPR